MDDWAQIGVAFFVSHMARDYLLQTDFQAANKPGGLGRDPVARRALFGHLLTYILAFVPVLIWVGIELGLPAALAVAALIWLPHLVVDDGGCCGPTCCASSAAGIRRRSSWAPSTRPRT